MNDRLGLIEFFAMEAGDYLERLDALVSPSATPDTDQLVKLTRALRGSALMANQRAVADVAASFEHLARAIRDDRCEWDEATRQLSIGAVDDLKTLIRATSEWGPEHQSKAEQIARELDERAGGAPPARSKPRTTALDAGTRAFVSREGAQVAAALEQAATELEGGFSEVPLENILGVMQPLRGIASLSEFPPLPELLDGIERAISEVSRTHAAHREAGALFGVAARALSRASKEVSALGTPEPESREVQSFAGSLAALLNLGGEVIPIEQLYYSDGPAILERGEKDIPDAQMANLEIVSRGDHLRQAADELDQAQSPTQRTLRAQSLADIFGVLNRAAGDQFATRIAQFGRAGRDAVTNGVAVDDTARFTALLRDAAEILTDAPNGDADALAERLERVIADLTRLGMKPEAQAEPEAASQVPAMAEPADSFPEPAVPTPSEPAGAPGFASLADSIALLEELVETRGLGKASLEELLAGATAAMEPDPVVAAPRPAVQEEPVPTVVLSVKDFCYSGEEALQRALSLRQEVSLAVESEDRSAAEIQALIDEVFDLVQLSLED